MANKYKETAVPFDLKDIKKGLNGASFLINTTTMGMRGGPASIKIDFLRNTSAIQLAVANGIASIKIILKKSTNSKERRGFALNFRVDWETSVIILGSFILHST